MRRMHYHKEISMYRDLALFALFLSVIIFLVLDNNLDYTVILVSSAIVIISMFSSLDGILLLYKKTQCKTKGNSYEGRITGKIGRSTVKNGYYYKLNVLYKNGKIIRLSAIASATHSAKPICSNNSSIQYPRYGIYCIINIKILEIKKRINEIH